MKLKRWVGPLLVTSFVWFAWAQPKGEDQPIVPDPTKMTPAPENSPSTSASPSASPTPSGSQEFETTSKPGIYISDSGNHRLIYMEDLSGKGRKAFGRPGHEPGYFLHPSQVWVDPKGKIFVADRDNDRVVRMDALNGWGWVTLDGLKRPEGVASRGDEIYVADTGNDQVLVYTEFPGKPVRTYKDPRLVHPTGIWLDQNKDIYVTCGQDPPGGRLVKLVEPTDTSGAKWEIYEGQNLKQLGFAPSQMVTFKSKLWLVDPVANRLVRVDNFQGRSAREWGGYGSSLGKFRSPVGLGLSKEGVLYVADSGNDRIVEVTGLDPKSWRVYDGEVAGGMKLRNPTSVFNWCPVPAPPPPPDEDKKKKKP